jgi:hypothetical protein
MTSHRNSYAKTIFTALALTLILGCLAILSLYYLPSPFGLPACLAVSLLGLLTLGVAAGGLLCLYRDHLQWSGKQDIFYGLLRSSEDFKPAALRRLLRPLLGRGLRPGDLVRVRSATEIQHTLDQHGMLENLPFMPEMLPCCGQIFRVQRRIDKINDMITKTGLRRFTNTVTLRALRCDGNAHGGCQAECQILWKEAWLERIGESSGAPVSDTHCTTAATSSVNSQQSLAELLKASTTQASEDITITSDSSEPLYQCQITELLKASQPMKSSDIRQDLRSLLWGNVELMAFLVALLTRLFNAVQSLRGGVDYPWRPEGQSAKTPREDLDLQAGEWVRVKDGRAIALTLDRNNRNRGMWFDREMLRFCGQVFQVRNRVEKLIDERNGQLLCMKTPCISLEDVTGTGEFLRFCPQNEYIFWREIWLERLQRD